MHMESEEKVRNKVKRKLRIESTDGTSYTVLSTVTQ